MASKIYTVIRDGKIDNTVMWDPEESPEFEEAMSPAKLVIVKPEKHKARDGSIVWNTGQRGDEYDVEAEQLKTVSNEPKGEPEGDLIERREDIEAGKAPPEWTEQEQEIEREAHKDL